jgi:response regulator RpfG family c-di-GMP phosphodiesterase/serine/threonine protein kinase
MCPVDRTGVWHTGAVLPPVSSRDSGCPPLRQFLDSLRESRLLEAEELNGFLAERPGLGDEDTPAVIDALVARGLLNEYQIRRVASGQTFGLVLGHYRIVSWLGSGGMGVVYKAEHIHMKRPVAIKVMVSEADANAVFLERFRSEMQALATLHHPNIVLAFDAGEVAVPGTAHEVLRYLVMEYAHGKNLEQLVVEEGALPISVACDYIRQAASGLRHAYEHGLVHRDIKPSNLLVEGASPDADGSSSNGRIKILDFGLARMCRRRYTEAHVVLGTVDYMAPEQARDARSVDIRADIYGLGGTLYWLLTGQRPFPGNRSPLEELLARQHETPALPRSLRPDIPVELEAIVCQMMARDPNDRFPTPLAVVAALNDFLESNPAASAGQAQTWREGSSRTVGGAAPGSPADTIPGTHLRRVLVVSPRGVCRAACRGALKPNGIAFGEVPRGADARAALERFPAEVVLIDSQLDEGTGLDLCRQLRTDAPSPNLKLIILAADVAAEKEATDSELLCDDVVPRASVGHKLLRRVRMLLRMKDGEDRVNHLSSHLLATNAQLEQALQQRDATANQAQDVLIFAIAKMAEMRGQETGGHLMRMQKYVRVLAEEAMQLPAFASVIDNAYVRMLERCVLLHDIGKVAIPDHILLKPGKLDAEERSIMESHTLLGANMLEAVARQQGACLAFLQMAVDIVRHHHEQYDGSGYPHGLAGDAIPLSARIVTIADVYDAMRSKLVYKPGLAHAPVRRLMLSPTQTQFDPALMVAFRQCEPSFEQTFAQTPDA